jgi:hypothetical protein
MIEAIAKTHFLQGVSGALASLYGRHTTIDERLHHVLQGRLTRQQVEALENETDFAIAHGGELVIA